MAWRAQTGACLGGCILYASFCELLGTALRTCVFFHSAHFLKTCFVFVFSFGFVLRAFKLHACMRLQSKASTHLFNPLIGLLKRSSKHETAGPSSNSIAWPMLCGKWNRGNFLLLSESCP